MIPNPLHPALVHFPIVLALLLPLVVIAAFVAVKRGVSPGTAWLAPIALAFLLLVSTWITVETGEEEEDVVEDVVAHETLETHEEAGKRFLLLSLVSLLVIAGGAAPGRTGQIGRASGAVMSIVLAVAVFGVGRSGGELVYIHGAAGAYASAPAAETGEGLRDLEAVEHDDEEDDEEDDERH
jgi:uncharacterized membrane protein